MRVSTLFFSLPRRVAQYTALKEYSATIQYLEELEAKLLVEEAYTESVSPQKRAKRPAQPLYSCVSRERERERAREEKNFGKPKMSKTTCRTVDFAAQAAVEALRSDHKLLSKLLDSLERSVNNEHRLNEEFLDRSMGQPISMSHTRSVPLSGSAPLVSKNIEKKHPLSLSLFA